MTATRDSDEPSMFDMVRRMDALQANQERLSEKFDAKFERLEELIVELKKAQEKDNAERCKCDEKRDGEIKALQTEIGDIKVEEIAPLKSTIAKHDEKFRNVYLIFGGAWSLLVIGFTWMLTKLGGS